MRGAPREQWGTLRGREWGRQRPSDLSSGGRAPELASLLSRFVVFAASIGRHNFWRGGRPRQLVGVVDAAFIARRER